MGDTIIFISAYETTSYSKSKRIFNKTQGIKALLGKHHFDYILIGDKLISRKGVLQLNTDYNYIDQNSSFSFKPIKDKNDIDEFEDIIKNTGYCVKLLQAQSVLADPAYFKIDYVICMNSFLVYIDKQVFQIDPIVFSLNQTLIIAFEVINYKTGIPIRSNEIFCKKGNYNLLPVNEYQYFDDKFTTKTNKKISEIIYNNVSDFFTEMIERRFIPENYSFIHDTLVLSNEITDVASYFCKLIGIRELPSSLENISTVEAYNYYPQDGASVITNYDPNDINTPLYCGIMLESIKLYVYLSQIVNAEITKNFNKVIFNNLYLENLFFAPHVPIQTYNLLNFIYSSESYHHYKEATKLKISYMTAENESKKNRNGVFLNFLLYIISLISAIGTLDTLDCRLAIPFKYSSSVVLLAFLAFGAIWGITELKRNRRF